MLRCSATAPHCNWSTFHKWSIHAVHKVRRSSPCSHPLKTMQNEAFECCDEVEPRRMPEQASKFDCRPIPVVPEVSLILEKSQQMKKMDDTAVNTMPEMRSSVQRDASFKGESYAAWKEKQFPQQSIRSTPNRLHEIYSSTQIANSTQNSPILNQSYSRDTPKNFSVSRSDGQLQNSNKYVLSHARIDNESHYHLNSSPDHNHLTRSHNTEGRISSDRRRCDQNAYETRFHNRDEIRSPYDKKPSDYDRRSNTINKRSDQDVYASRFHNQDGVMSPHDTKRSVPDSYSSRHYNKDEKSSPNHIRRVDHPQGLDSNDRRSEHLHGVESSDRRRSDHSHSSESSSQRRSDHSHSSESSNHRRSDHSHPAESSGRRSSDHSRAVEPYDMRPKTRIQRSSSCSKADSYMHRSTSLDHDYHPKHSRSLQPVHCSPDHSHSYSHHHYTCCSNHNSTSTETETVKNLLNIITSQNEQIKHLQKQVERLLKLHEQTLQEKNICTCQSNGRVYQNPHHIYEQHRTPNLPIGHSNGLEENERYNVEKCFSDLKMQDEKNQQAILEQKVSIGVMTSFELKLQNNPNLGGDTEMKYRNGNEKVLPGSGTSNMIKNLVNDTGEMMRKKSNFFNPNALENISEASESHMSSLRQSHMCSDTTRQSIEAQDSVDVQNTNQYKHQYEESQSRVPEISKKVSRNQINSSNGKNSKRKTNGGYKMNDQRFEENDNHVENMSPFVYNFEYDNVCSSPQEDFNEKRSDQFNREPLMTDVTKMKSKKCDNYPDENLSLSSSDLDVEDFNPQSPEPSIHLDMQEFSSEGGSLPPQRAGGKVGWTIYNNVLDQVNKILQNTRDDSEDEEEELPSNGIRKNDKKEYDNNIMDTVKAATLEQLTKLGISFSDNESREPNYNKKVLFDQTSYYARQGPEGHVAATSGSIETNTSMHMKALAMKYLNEEQLADMAMQKPRASALKQVPGNGQNSNMSIATMHYLQRYHLLPGNNPGAMREAQVMREDYRGPVPMMTERPAIRNAERREASPHRYVPFSGTSKVSYPSKILDISTLKQQPKLL